MSIRRELMIRLIAFCIELGYIKFDDDTIKRLEVAAPSYVVEWKIPEQKKESTTEFLKLSFSRNRR